MKIFYLAIIGLMLVVSPQSASGQSSSSVGPERAVIPSGTLRLTGLLWRPTGSGPFPAVLFTHGSGRSGTRQAGALGPVFARHGYAFLFLFRRGAGLSEGQGEWMNDLLDREAAARGDEARKRLQLRLLTTDHLDDMLAGLAFLKGAAGIDGGRIAVAGHSFGGQLSLLVPERDKSVRAVVTFAAAAMAWEGSPELRERLLAAVRNSSVPILLTHAANDFSTVPGQRLAAELARLKRPHDLKIYPAVGNTQQSGHGAVYLAISIWERDVFRFLDEHVRQ